MLKKLFTLTLLIGASVSISQAQIHIGATTSVTANVLLDDGLKMENVDVSSLEILDRDYMKDANRVFYDTQEIPLADPQSFTPVYEEYSKDKKHAYYKSIPLKDVNPATFSFDYASGLASDGKYFLKDGVVVDKPTQ